MDGCRAKIAATAAITGAVVCKSILKYKARVTAMPVFNILAPNVTCSNSLQMVRDDELIIALQVQPSQSAGEFPAGRAI